MKSLAKLLLPGDKEFPIIGGCSIGREANSDLIFEDPHLSRHHARIQRRGEGEFWLKDLGSTNGTLINGKAVAHPQQLGNGDRIEVGCTEIVFRAVARTPPEPAPAAPSEDSKDSENLEKADDPDDSENLKDADESDNSENPEDTDESKGFEDLKSSENLEEAEAASKSGGPSLVPLARKIVVESPDTVAEASFSVPAVRAIALAHPDTALIMLANPDLCSLWRQVSQVERVIEIPHGASTRLIEKKLRESGIRFGSSLAWEATPAARAFAKIGIKQRLGEAGGKVAKHLTHPVELKREPGPIQHRVEHYLLLAREIGADPFQTANFAPPERPPELDPPRIAIVPGSDYGPAAEWLPERFQELAEAIQAEAQLAILASPGRKEPAAKLAKSLDLPLTNLSGDKLLQFLAECRALVGNDGSLPHLASFVGTPSVVLFGPNEPEWRRPLGRIHRTIRHHVPCSGCLLPKCPLDHRCLTEIEVAEVQKQVQELLTKK